MKHVLYFTADWCVPCKRVKPIVEEINKDSLVKFQIINVDHEKELAKSLELRSVPTFILFENEKEIARITGAKTKQELLDFISNE
jgi:thioredoxin 1